MKKWKLWIAGMMLTASLGMMAACGNGKVDDGKDTKVDRNDNVISTENKREDLENKNTEVHPETGVTGTDNGEAGSIPDAVEDVVDGVGEAGKDVIDGVENGVDDLTDGVSGENGAQTGTANP